MGALCLIRFHQFRKDFRAVNGDSLPQAAMSCAAFFASPLFEFSCRQAMLYLFSVIFLHSEQPGSLSVFPIFLPAKGRMRIGECQCGRLLGV
jgi:hypothetical protein